MAEDIAKPSGDRGREPAGIGKSDLLALTDALVSQEIDRLEEVEELKARARAAEDRIAQLQKELEALRAHRDALVSSTSWKVTGPVRALSRLLRGR